MNTDFKGGVYTLTLQNWISACDWRDSPQVYRLLMGSVRESEMQLTVFSARENGVFSLPVCAQRHEVSTGFQSWLAARGSHSILDEHFT